MIQAPFKNNPKIRECLFVLLALLGLCSPAFSQERLLSLNVPEEFSIEFAADPALVYYPMCIAFGDRGRLFIAESSGKDLSGKEMAANPECKIVLLEDLDLDQVFDRRTVFAEGLSLPMGVLWHDGALYVASPPDLLRFEDVDGDGFADKREILLTGWNVLNTASLHGPFLGPDGWLYLTHGRHGYEINTKEGEFLTGLAARIWRCRTDGTGLERVAGGGFDNPVELIFTNAGEAIGTMTYFTDPMNGQRDGLMHFVEGGVYPKVHSALKEFRLTGELLPPMTRFARIAPAGLERYRGAAFGEEFEGDLFSAQFNPHRVQRHKLIRDGATFRTEDSDFLTSTDPDFHPTDVLEDADGSLLVVDTGGWYVDACPLSRVAKPDRRGAIYRIRRVGAPRIEDPWGMGEGLERDDPNALADLLGDARPRVRDRAITAIATFPTEETVEILRRTIEQSRSRTARISALWAASRIGTPEAYGLVRGVINDRDFELRIAAAHALGLARDEAALSPLISRLRDEIPAVRREVATALGRIGEAAGARALVAALGRTGDRFEEHSVIHALIEINEPEPAAKALGDPNEKIRRGALIALDQMRGSTLEASQWLAALEDESEMVRGAALWVGAHRVDWADEAAEFVANRLDDDSFDPSNAEGLGSALHAFAAEASIQEVIAERLGASDQSVELRLFLLGVIGESGVAEWPESWIDPLAQSLADEKPDVRWAAVRLVRSRSISALDEALSELAGDGKQTDRLRLAALETLAPRRDDLSDEAFDFLIAALESGGDPAVRLTASRVLGAAPLDEAQRLALAGEHFAEADPLIAPGLAAAFAGRAELDLGQAIVDALADTPELRLTLGADRLASLLAGFPEAIRAEAEPLLAELAAEREELIAEMIRLEPWILTGDVGRGRRLFFSERTACSTCHAIGAEGGTLGPDLTSIGEIRAGRDLLEAVMFPSSTLVPGYESWRVTTAAGKDHSGIIGPETDDWITLNTGADAQLRLARAEIAELSPSEVSIMPEGFAEELTRSELLDLIAFLLAQNGEQWLQAKRWESSARD